jgi:hypothetical protein
VTENEKTSKRVASETNKILLSTTASAIAKSVAASALTQVPKRIFTSRSSADLSTSLCAKPTGENRPMTWRAHYEQPDETPMMKMVATAAGVVIGVSVLAIVIGITSKGYSILTRNALPSLQERVSKAWQRQTRLTQAPPVALEPSLPGSVLPQTPEQTGSLKQFPGPAAAAQSSPKPVDLGATQRVQSPSTVALPIASGKVHMAIKATHTLGSWIDVCADGQTVVRKYLPEQGTVAVSFANNAVVRLGNSGGVEISLNGAQISPLGRAGQPRVVQFSAEGLHFLMPGDPGSACGRP